MHNCISLGRCAFLSRVPIFILRYPILYFSQNLVMDTHTVHCSLKDPYWKLDLFKGILSAHLLIKV